MERYQNESSEGTRANSVTLVDLQALYDLARTAPLKMGMHAPQVAAAEAAQPGMLISFIEMRGNHQGDVMIKLYDSAFSPFARKVRMVLEHKGLRFEATDGLLEANHDALEAVNGRVEVPVLVDGDVVVVNSADIVAYLECCYPTKPVYPEAPAARFEGQARRVSSG